MSRPSIAADAGDTLARIAKSLEGVEHTTPTPRDGMPCIAVERAALREALVRLRDGAGFAGITLLTAIDHQPSEPRFEVVHQLMSLEHGDRVRVRTAVPEGDDPAAATCPTCVDLWAGAAFMEREVYDMFGIVFEGHEGLKRLLMPDGYGHHPLRKDFPHQGIEPDRLYRQWDEARRAELEGGA